MKLIFISGPSGSGKTTLSKKIIGKIKNGIILSTDNYYKVGLISKLLSKFVSGYFDRSISFNYNLFKKDLNFIIKNGISNLERSYDFDRKSIKNSRAFCASFFNDQETIPKFNDSKTITNILKIII